MTVTNDEVDLETSLGTVSVLPARTRSWPRVNRSAVALIALVGLAAILLAGYEVYTAVLGH